MSNKPPTRDSRAARDQLHINLQELDAQLRELDSINPLDRELLSRLQSDIAAVLNRTQDDEDHYGGLTERLQESVARLEATHPRITLMMRQAIDSLAYLGI
jgi:uncharacterized protein YaaN involved in tellurite resistance